MEITQFSNKSNEEILQELRSNLYGLDSETVAERLNQFGKNSFEFIKNTHPIIQYFMAFCSPLPIILLGLAIISFMTGGINGAIVIMLMIFLSTSLAFFQEYKSNKAAEKLRAMVGITTTVIRESKEQEISLNNVVPGDIVKLSAGDLIPADLRILHSKDLFINQSSLTGEALPVEKLADASNTLPNSPFDLVNICFMGSHVVSGIGKGVVIHTGINTYFGKLTNDIAGKKKISSFDKGIQKSIWLIIKFMLVMALIVFIINGSIKGNWMEAFIFATAIAVGLTPEMLPLLVTINLAKGAMAMSRKKVIVKRLNAIQNIGAMDILCTDKTGTLTQNEIILEKYINILGDQDEQVFKFAYLNSHYQSGLKNLLDLAVLKHTDLYQKLNLNNQDLYQKVDEIPFDFQRRRMSVILQENNFSEFLICKGAVEEITQCCNLVQIENKLYPLDEKKLQEMQQLVNGLNNDGFMVIAVAIKYVPNKFVNFSVAQESNMTLLGYIAFLDPPKESAKPAIENLQKSGVKIKILTGDNELVARKVCQKVGLLGTNVLLGSQMDGMSDQELTNKIEQCDIFAKLTPHQKSHIISLLQKNSHVVGFLGDGINDGPALKTADVSVSVDTAVDIAKDSADIILLEKSLLVLHDGVIEGRKVFGNIMKYIKMSSSSNFGNVLSMLGASTILPFLPMAPMQILLNNFLYDCSQTAVPTDSVDEEYLAKPRIWDLGNITHFMLFIGPISSLFDYATFGFMWFFLHANKLECVSLFQTGWFVESLLSQTLIVHIIRTNKIPFIESKPSLPLLITTTAICVLGAVLPYTFIGKSMQMVPLPGVYWVGLTIILILYFMLTQAVKSFLFKKFNF